MSDSNSCPSCGLINPPDAVICDCGYNILSPLARLKANDILNVVHDSLRARRRENGLSPLFNTEALGIAAQELSQPIATIEQPDLDASTSEYHKRVSELGYSAPEVSTGFYRQMVPLEIYHEDAAREILESIPEAVQSDVWEDYGVGATTGAVAGRPGEFGLCVVFGFGYTDGHALVVQHINDERKKVGVPPLEIDDRLRRLSRSYLAMPSVPRQQLDVDMEGTGYHASGYRTRWAYNGAYIPCPADLFDVGLNIRQIARVVADELLRVHRDLLLRPDWQHIGLALNREPVVPSEEPRVPSFLAEFVLGWRLSEKAKRPAHFPPPLESSRDRQVFIAPPGAEKNPELWRPARLLIDRPRPPKQRRQPRERRGRWWWPFG